MSSMTVLKRGGLGIAGIASVLALVGLNWQRVCTATEPPGRMKAQATTPPSSVRVRAEGRLVAYPGARITVGTDIGGTLKALPLFEKMIVKKGDVVAEIEATEQKAALAEARSRVKEAEVDLKLFEIELRRSESLFASQSVAQAAVDRSAHDLDSAAARRGSALATASRLAASLEKTRIVSPIDGVVLARLAESGETVAPGATLVTIADLSRTRVEAEVDEYDTGRIAVGADVTVSVEGQPGRVWHGKVEEIPDSVEPRRLKPQDPARPSDTRVLLVKIALGEATPIKLGQRVEVEIGAP